MMSMGYVHAHDLRLLFPERVRLQISHYIFLHISNDNDSGGLNNGGSAMCSRDYLDGSG